VLEVRRVGAVDHIIGRHAGCGLINLGYSIGERLAGRQATIRLQGKRNRNRQTGRTRRPDDADRLVRIGHCDRGRHVGAGLDKGADLVSVVGLRLLGRHDVTGS
jgi:hypothetical protein